MNLGSLKEMIALKNVNRVQTAVLNSKDLTPREKRARLDDLNAMSVKLSRRALNKEADDEGN